MEGGLNVQIDNNKERGWVMRILDRVYPDGLDQDTVKKQLIDLKFLTSEADIRSNVAYLVEKGLIRKQTVGTGELERIVISLTATGKDLLDGNILQVTGVDL